MNAQPNPDDDRERRESAVRKVRAVWSATAPLRERMATDRKARERAVRLIRWAAAAFVAMLLVVVVTISLAAGDDDDTDDPGTSQVEPYGDDRDEPGEGGED